MKRAVSDDILGGVKKQRHGDTERRCRDRDRDRDRGRERDSKRLYREREDAQKARYRARDRNRGRERDSERLYCENERSEREDEQKARHRARLEKLAERKREIALAAIKEQYLGSNKPKKKVIKPSDKFRISFGWDNTEDTSRDMNPLYQNPHEAQLLFSRGFRAGIDRREQKKLGAKNNRDGDLYDKFDMRVDRHWSEKMLDEMTERDWRIFREDFNISYKGRRVPRPMRSWEESELSPKLLKAVEAAGYKTPSPIQMAAIPLGLQQRDVIGVAETGSVK